MKRLNVNEINLVVNVIMDKLNENRYEKVKSKLEKDVDFKKLEKVSKEVSELNKKLRDLNILCSELNFKVRSKFDIMNVYVNESKELKISWKNNNEVFSKVRNELILMSIGKDIDIESIIDKIVKKFS